MYQDPIIDEIHKYRDQRAAKFNYSIKKLVNYYKDKQKKSGRQIVNFIKKSDKALVELH